MIGKGVQRFQIRERANKVAKVIQILVVICNARNYDVADPHVHLLLVQIFRESENTFVRLGGKLLVLFRVNVLDI